MLEATMISALRQFWRSCRTDARLFWRRRNRASSTRSIQNRKGESYGNAASPKAVNSAGSSGADHGTGIAPIFQSLIGEKTILTQGAALLLLRSTRARKSGKPRALSRIAHRAPVVVLPRLRHQPRSPALYFRARWTGICALTTA